MTPSADDPGMRVQRLRGLAVAAIAAAVSATAALAAPAPPIGSLPPGWSHAEINVVIRHRAHTWILDRGRVQSVSPSSIVLRERGGAVVEVPVAATTTIRINGRLGSLVEIRRGAMAITARLDGGPATLVRVVQRLQSATG
jgi:hypothetical protein